MVINYKKLLKKTDNKKYRNIYDKIRFIRGKSLREQLWWIRFYRLRTKWQEHYTDDFPGDRFVDKIIFNSNRPDDYRDPNPWDPCNYNHGWLGQNHKVNQILDEVVSLFEDNLIEWERLPLFDVVFPDVKAFV